MKKWPFVLFGLAGVATAFGLSEFKKIKEGILELDASEQFQKDFPLLYNTLKEKKVFPREIPVKYFLEMMTSKDKKKKGKIQKAIDEIIKYFTIRVKT
jgi:hypothetical protein